MKLKSKILTLSICFWIIVITLIELCAINFRFLHFGKDQGVIFRMIAFGISTSIYFLIINNFKYRLKTIIIGLIIGFISYVIVYTIYIIVSLILNHDNSGFDIPLLFDLIFSTLIVIIIGLKKYS